MKLNEIRDNHGARKKKMLVGRGIGCTKGKTSGRGVKGQKARTGVALAGFEGGQMPLHRRIPKRGFNNIFAVEHDVINIGRLEKAIKDGAIDAKKPINAATLQQAGMIGKAKGGLHLLAKGSITSKITIEVVRASPAAVAAVEKAGGKVVQTGAEAKAA